jgi:hypothetical protein
MLRKDLSQASDRLADGESLFPALSWRTKGPPHSMEARLGVNDGLSLRQSAPDLEYTARRDLGLRCEAHGLHAFLCCDICSYTMYSVFDQVNRIVTTSRSLTVHHDANQWHSAREPSHFEIRLGAVSCETCCAFQSGCSYDQSLEETHRRTR